MRILTEKGYTWKKHISTGGEGEVHLIQKADRQYVAKIYPTLSQPSLAVLKTIQELNLPGIPRIHDIFSSLEKTVVIRDFVEGATLYEEIRKNEFFSYQRARTITLKICGILSKLHTVAPHPIIYRDLKPENIIISPNGDVKLIDFGISRYYKTESVRDTVVAGTQGYTAPEVLAGMQSDERCDVYSAGLLLYEMLTGKNLLAPPFQIRPVGESNPLLPDGLDEIIAKATDMNPANRYRTMDAFAEALHFPLAERNNGREPGESRRLKRLRRVTIATFLTSVTIVASLIWTQDALGGGRETGIPDDTGILVATNNGAPALPTVGNDTSDFVETPGSVETQGLEENQDSVPTEQGRAGNDKGYELTLDLQFNHPDDLLWLDILSRDPSRTGATHADYSGLLQNGLFNLDKEFNMKYNFEAGDFFHVRLKPGEAKQSGILLLLCFAPKLGSEWSESSYEIKFENKQMLSGEIRNDYGYYTKPAKGSALLVNNNWMDVIVVLDAGGDSFRYFAFDSADPAQMVYGGAAVFDPWKQCDYQISTDLFEEYWIDSLGEEMPRSQIDFIRQGKGSVWQYIEEAVGGGPAGKDKIAAFLSADIEFIGEELFTQHGY